MDADAGGLFDDAGADLEQAPADGGELGPVERHPARHRIAEREHQPVGGGVEHKPELVGGRALAGGAVGGELDLVLLDEALGLAAGAVDPFVEMAGLACERGDDVACVEAARRRLQPGNHAALAVSRAGGVGEGGEAAHPVCAGLGAAYLEVVSDVVGEAVQHGIAGQAEDVIDAVRLAPRHGLGPAVVAVAAEGQPGARPVPADATHQVLQQDADLIARGRLAGAQENRHRLAALDMVDVHRQKAARGVMGVEQRQLLVAVNPVAGVVDVERDRRRRGREGAVEQIDQGGRQAHHLDPRGRVLQPAHSRLGTEIAATLRHPADRRLEQRIGAQRVAVVGISAAVSRASASVVSFSRPGVSWSALSRAAIVCTVDRISPMASSCAPGCGEITGGGARVDLAVGPPSASSGRPTSRSRPSKPCSLDWVLRRVSSSGAINASCLIPIVHASCSHGYRWRQAE